ncbi:MAG: hypothetical protein JZU55_05165 [Afipia sp.]|jgi:hypothetical protein|nr:hypothetical protein [Afipia sp.]MCR6733488.1 hypothetical protein [Afipia sp.]
MSEARTSDGLISEGEDYQLLAGEDGVSFVLRSKAEHLVAHLRGDDAMRFRADYDAIRVQYPAWKPDQTLAQLWDQGGYSWLAAQEGE